MFPLFFLQKSGYVDFWKRRRTMAKVTEVVSELAAPIVAKNGC